MIHIQRSTLEQLLNASPSERSVLLQSLKQQQQLQLQPQTSVQTLPSSMTLTPIPSSTPPLTALPQAPTSQQQQQQHLQQDSQKTQQEPQRKRKNYRGGTKNRNNVRAPLNKTIQKTVAYMIDMNMTIYDRFKLELPNEGQHRVYYRVPQYVIKLVAKESACVQG